jgi:hypothetical protein
MLYKFYCAANYHQLLILYLWKYYDIRYLIRNFNFPSTVRSIYVPSTVHLP